MAWKAGQNPKHDPARCGGSDALGRAEPPGAGEADPRGPGPIFSGPALANSARRPGDRGHRTLRPDRWRLVPVWGLLSALGLMAKIGHGAETAPLPGLLLKDFVWPEYHPAPHDKQLRFRLQAAQAEPMEGAWVRAREVTLERFTLEGQQEWFVHCDHCQFHTATQEARSEGPLELRLQSERLILTGQGFLWRQSNAWLVVSNQVRTTLRGGWWGHPRGDALAPVHRIETTPNEIRIEADQFVYAGLDGLAEFTGKVNLRGSNLVLRADRLRFTLPTRPEARVTLVTAEGNVRLERAGLRAEAARMVLDPTQDRLELAGRVRWQREDASGAADSLTVDWTRETLQARGHAILDWPQAGGGFLPRPGLEPGQGPGPTQLTVRSSRYQLTANTAEFDGPVEVVETPATGPVSRLWCDGLVVRTTADGQLDSVIASGSIRFERQPLQLEGRQAIYRARSHRMEITGPAHWQDDQRSGSGDHIWIDLARQQFGVEGRAELIWPRPSNQTLLALAGPPPGNHSNRQTPPNESEAGPPRLWTRIQCAAYVWSASQLDFTGGVHVDDPGIELSCAHLSILPSPDEEQDPDLIATGGVVLHLRTPGQPEVTARCQEARYIGHTGILHLTGQPVIEREDGSRFMADAIEYHRRTGVISTVGTVRARVERGESLGTNALPTFSWPR